MITALVGLIFGMIGSYAFLRFGGEPRPSPGADRPDHPVYAGPSTRDLNDQIARLTERVDGMSQQIKAIPEPAPPPDLCNLQVRVAEISKETEEIPSFREEIRRIDGRIDAMSQSIAAINSELHAIPARAGTASPTSANTGNGQRAEARAGRPDSPVRPESVNSVSEQLAPPDVLQQGITLFQQQKYKDASELFNKLEQTSPDDARVWYYAALAHGFATDQWSANKAGRLAEKGIERERAGTPPRAAIDDALKDLTSATGRDWLASYRSRVNPPR